MSWTLFSTTFTLVFLSELPDKTAFAAILMSGRGRFLPLFLGFSAAFFVQTAIAVWLGGFASLLPRPVVQAGVGILFLVFSFLTWRKTRIPEESHEFENESEPSTSGAIPTFLKAFFVIFAAEWGDLTQLSTASLAARYSDRLSVFSGAFLALISVSALALILGKQLQLRIRPRTFLSLSSAALGLLGLYFLLEATIS
jgi:putative Ca2+/H+ antiporter (TMEM165/GDT1 family)